MASSLSFTITESGAEPYMLSLVTPDIVSHEEMSLAPTSLELQSLEDRLMAAFAEDIDRDAEEAARKKAKKAAKSRPPSPPESGSATPRVTIAPCPIRLRPYIPPPNYGTVELHKVFRSSFPQDRHMDFVKTLGIRSMLTLVDTESSDGYQEWVRDSGITQKMINVATNKDGYVSTTVDSICEALLFVMDSSNHPLYIHCNQGKHRTGCIVACLRKVQRMPIEDIIAEYRVYSEPKARPGDIAFIESFDPESVFSYAKTHGYLDGPSQRLKRLDSNVTNVDTLAAALSAGAMAGEVAEEVLYGSSVSPTSTTSDEAMEITLCDSNSSTERAPAHGEVTVRDMQFESRTPVDSSASVIEIEDDATSNASSDTDFTMIDQQNEITPGVTSMFIDPALV
ncbi:tyrosine-protein phosphatase siw14 [Saxophila tyrrhenica]|uniref:Tyrosine-protein phosphatase siw14 n=1 Tax=Saxophila tyrrhenica TaxID=1690608 RepID=A0AAV9PD22_9PEZI|nr:tyrosine-protein phosphatase siw14 [Saxophila tyrrhenica]